ncbi:MAG: P1 family peptidase [Alphaproteobacteria bacterium]
MLRRTSLLCQAGLALALAALPAPHARAADQSGLAANTAISGPALTFDWPAIEIGVGSYEEGPTGVTIFRFPKGATAAVDVRGGAPGTVNTDLLRLGYGAPFVRAVVLTGGSAYGEEAITAVETGLKDDGAASGAWDDIALVPGAVIYDFGGRRLNAIYPDKRLAQAALHALRPGVFPLGAQGAGRMAMQGGYFNCLAHSGQGGAFRQVGATKIAAFVVVNALGAVTDRDGRLASCNRGKSWGDLAKTSELLGHLPESLKPQWDASAAEKALGAPSQANTTISLVVTNQKLLPWALQRLAVQVQSAMARAIQPFSTQLDGDTLFAVSTGEVEGKELSPLTLGAIAGELMWDAILASVPQEEPFVPPATPAAVGVDTLAAYAGKYAFGDAALLEVRVEDGKLMIRSAGEGPVFEFGKAKPTAAIALSASEFYVDGRYHTRIAFTKDQAGGVTGAVLNPGRWEQIGKRAAAD